MIGTRTLLAVALVSLMAAPAVAAQRYAVIVSGASGGEKYLEQYEGLRTRLVTLVADRLRFGRDHVFPLGERPHAGVQLASGDNVRRTLAALARRMHADDLLLVVLVGHGTFDGQVAKFNLVGPDLDASQWAALLRPVPGRVVVVDSSGASFPFLAALSAKGRIVITATDNPGARYDTVFAECFVKALEQAAGPAGSVAPVSVWELFTMTNDGVKRYYAQRGLLPVEHPMLDDAGDGFGKDADQPGTDPALAQNVYLTSDAGAASEDPATRELRERRDDLLARIEQLKAAKGSMGAGDYAAKLESLLVELAKVSRELRQKGVQQF